MSGSQAPRSSIAAQEQGFPAPSPSETVGFNAWLAVRITRMVGSMWCAYAFAALALISLPAAIGQGTAAVVSWISQTFLQLVLLSVIMVGQRVLATASDKQALQTSAEAEAVLQLAEEVRRLREANRALADEVRQTLALKGA